MVGLGCRWCAGVINVAGGWSVCVCVCWCMQYEFVEGSFLPVALVDQALHCIPDHKEPPSHMKTRSFF